MRLPESLPFEKISARALELKERTCFKEGALNLAVSGGPDSVGMALLAWGLRLKFSIHHVDHGIRQGSEEEARFVSELSRLLAAPFYLYKASVEAGAALEERARRARQELLPDDACFAHTMEDRAETVLFNVMRGAGLQGLGALYPSFKHPVVRLRRGELRELCELAGIEPVKDPMNEDESLTRNAIRLKLLPLMNAVMGRDVVPAICRLSDLAYEEDRFLETMTPAPGSLEELLKLPYVLKRRALSRALRKGGYRPDLKEVNKALKVIEGEVRAVELEGGWRLEARGDGIYLEKELLWRRS